MSLDTGLVHGGNQNQKVFAIDDVIPDSDKAKRPFKTACPKTGNPDNDLYRIMDELHVDGEERSSAEATTLTAKRVEKRQQIGARLHHIEEAVEVGMVSQQNKGYGRGGLSEYEFQRKRVLMDQLDAWERVLCGRGTPQAGNGSGTAYKTRGASEWITASTTDWAADSDTDISDDFRTPSGSIVELHLNALTKTEVTNRMVLSQLDGVLGSLWDVARGQDEFDVICTRIFKEMVSTFIHIDKVADGLTTIARFNGDIERKRLGYIVEVYATETGVFTFKMTTFLPPASGATASVEALVLNWKHAEIAVRNEPGFYKVGNTLLSEKTAVAGTLGLAMRPRFNGKFTRASS